MPRIDPLLIEGIVHRTLRLFANVQNGIIIVVVGIIRRRRCCCGGGVGGPPSRRRGSRSGSRRVGRSIGSGHGVVIWNYFFFFLLKKA